MKIKVDKITAKEFSEYTDASFAKSVKMTLKFFLGINALAILLVYGFNLDKNVIKPLWISAFLLSMLLILSGSATHFIYKKSRLGETKASYSFSSDKMDISLGNLEGDLSYEYVKRIKETAGLFIISVKGSEFIIPKRCVDESDFLGFFEKVLPDEKIKRMKYKKKTPGEKR